MVELGPYMYRQEMLKANISFSEDNEELSHWFEMVGAEIDMDELKAAILGDGENFALEFTRERFTDFMCKKTKHHRREYDLGVNA